MKAGQSPKTRLSNRKKTSAPSPPSDAKIVADFRGKDAYELDDLDRKIVKQLMEFPHTSNVEMSEMFQCNEKTIRNHLKKPAVIKAFKELSEKAWEMLERGQIIAMRQIMKLCTDPDKRISLDACKYILQPLLNKGEININQYQEIIHRTRFGEKGQMISETEQVPIETPKNTLELLEGKIIDAEES